MNENSNAGIDNLLSLFSDALTPADVLSAKLIAQISGAITSERLKRNMSPKNFAEYIGTPQSLIVQFESGNYNFSIQEIAEIFTKLNLNANLNISNSNVEVLGEEL